MVENSIEVVQAGERRSARVESLRAIAALAVLLAHVFAYAHGWSPVIYSGFLHRAIMGGGFGVQLFFALSGYLLYRAFAKRDFAEGRVDLGIYARNRALRILPLYYVVVIVLLLFTQRGGTLGQWWRFLFFFEEFSTKTAQTVDAPIWSLVVEIIFYILLPLIAWAIARASNRSPVKAAAILLVLGGASAALHQANPAPSIIWSYSFPSTFYGFVPGMLLAIADVTWRGQLPGRMKGAAANSDVWVAASVIVWLIIFWRYSLVLLTAPASFLVVGACVLPLRSKNVVRVLDWRPLALVGVASYSLYLWHVPIIEHLAPHAPKGTLGLLALSLPASLAAAALSYAIIERTALQFRRRWATQAAPQPSGESPTATDRLSRMGVQVRDSAWIAGIALVALVARLAAIASTHQLTLGSDPSDYNRLGRLIAAGHGFGTSALSPSGGPTAFRAPLYPIFLGAVYRVTGNSITAARVLEAFIGVAAVVMIGAIAYLLWGRKVALVSMAIAAVFPSLIIYSTSLLTETLFIPLELLAVLAVLLHRRSARMGWLILSGASAGLGVLARPNGSVVIIGLAVIVLAAARGAGWGRRIRNVIVLGVAAVVVMAPWEIRTASDFHEAVAITTVDGYNLAGVYNSQAASSGYPTHYQWRPPSGIPEFQPLFHDPKLNEATLGDKLWTAGEKYITGHPAALPSAMFWNSYRTAELAGVNETTTTMQEAGFGRSAALVSMAAFWLLCLLAVIGLVSRRARGAPIGLWLAPVLLWLISVPFLGTTRIRAPIDPFIVLLAAVGVVWLLDRRRPRAAETVVETSEPLERAAIETADIETAGAARRLSTAFSRVRLH